MDSGFYGFVSQVISYSDAVTLTLISFVFICQVNDKKVNSFLFAIGTYLYLILFDKFFAKYIKESLWNPVLTDIVLFHLSYIISSLFGLFVLYRLHRKYELNTAPSAIIVAILILAFIFLHLIMLMERTLFGVNSIKFGPIYSYGIFLANLICSAFICIDALLYLYTRFSRKIKEEL